MIVFAMFNGIQKACPKFLGALLQPLRLYVRLVLDEADLSSNCSCVVFVSLW